MKDTANLIMHPIGIGKAIGSNRYVIGWQGAAAQYTILAIYNNARQILNRADIDYDATTLDRVALAVARAGSAVSFYSWVSGIECSYPLSESQQKIADRQTELAEKEITNSIAELNAVIQDGEHINIITSADYSNGIVPSFVLKNGETFNLSWCFDDGHDATFCDYDAIAAQQGWKGHKLLKGGKVKWGDRATSILSKMRQLQFEIIHFYHVPELVKNSELHASIANIAKRLMEDHARQYVARMEADHGIDLSSSKLAWMGNLITLDGFPLSEHMIPPSAH